MAVPEPSHAASRCWITSRPESLGPWPTRANGTRVRVWLCPIDGTRVSDADLHMLDGDERRSAAAFKGPALRGAFVASHVALRRVLAAQLRVPPHDLAFRHGTWGKPQLGVPFQHLRFNLSHSGGWALIALTYAGCVGVDVESIASEPPLDLDLPVFTKAEVAVLRCAGSSSWRSEVFYNLWCRKEALAKGLGIGLGENIRTLDVAEGLADPQARARISNSGDHGKWYVRSLPRIPGAASAIAVTRPDLTIQALLFDW